MMENYESPLLIINSENHEEALQCIEELFQEKNLIGSIKTRIISEGLNGNALNAIIRKLNKYNITPCYVRNDSLETAQNDSTNLITILQKSEGKQIPDSDLSIIHRGQGKTNARVDKVSTDRLKSYISKREDNKNGEFQETFSARAELRKEVGV